MAFNIVVIVGSPRKNGNTNLLADYFIKGAEAVGSTVVKINLSGLAIGGCINCNYCISHDGECSIKDDMQKIYPILYQSDMVVFASPIYFYGLTAQLKAVIDRMYTLSGKMFPITSSALLLTYSDAEEAAIGPAVSNYQAFIGILQWQNKGIVSVSGTTQQKDIIGNPGLDEAEALGRNARE